MELLRDMALFVEVAKTKSFSKAAAVLGIPNSSLSRRITELEKTVGLRLFNRTTRRTELTDAGQIYYERCKIIVEEAQIAHEQLQDIAQLPTGNLRVSLSVDFGLFYLAPLLAEFTERYPNIYLDLDLSPKRADLLSEPLDLAIRMGELPDSTLYARRIGLKQLHLYAAPQYLANTGGITHPDDLQQHACISFRTTASEPVWTLNHGEETVTVKLNARLTMNNMGMVQRVAVLGLGIAMISDDMACSEVQSGRLLPILPEWSLPAVPIYAVTTSRLLPAKIRVFIEFLMNKLAE
jgi:DNA-binding transcriptional LysR family regulator